jgi:hypothetical protein
MDIAYVAGFFDGEGSVSMHSDTLEVSVVQAQLGVLEALRNQLGGTIRVHRSGVVADERQNGVRRQIWRWTLVGYAAAKFLREMEPYLIVKRDRTLKALKWWEDRLVSRSRMRMPDAYYKEARASGRNVLVRNMSKRELEVELAFRSEWMRSNA